MMKTRAFPYAEIAPNTYEIGEFDCASMFLLIGDEKAMLIDTGVGIGDLKGFVRTLTDKPLIVCYTHNHVDHVGNAGALLPFAVDKELSEEPPAFIYLLDSADHNIALVGFPGLGNFSSAADNRFFAGIGHIGNGTFLGAAIGRAEDEWFVKKICSAAYHHRNGFAAS